MRNANARSRLRAELRENLERRGEKKVVSVADAAVSGHQKICRIQVEYGAVGRWVRSSRTIGVTSVPDVSTEGPFSAQGKSRFATSEEHPRGLATPTTISARVQRGRVRAVRTFLFNEACDKGVL